MEGGRREFLIARGWVQATLLVVLFGLLRARAARVPDLPGRAADPRAVVDPGGRVLFTGDDIMHGQEVFLRNGLMEYGSIFGHGAYLGPDFTADYLRRAPLAVRDSYGGTRTDGPARGRSTTSRPTATIGATGRLAYSAAQAAAFDGAATATTATSSPIRARATGSGRARSPIPHEIRQLTAFFAWSAWTSAARRPGKDYSYTNNWPPEPLVDNQPTADAVVWSVLSLIALLGGIGLLFAAFGRWNFLGWHGREQHDAVVPPPGASGADSGAARHGLVLPGHGGCCSCSRRWSAAPRSTTAPTVELLRHRSGADSSLQPGAHLACAARRSSGSPPRSSPRHLPRAR